MATPTEVLLWTDSPAAYLDAIKVAGLEDRVHISTLPRKDRPGMDQLTRTEVLMAAVVPPGLLSTMPKLRWAQAMTAGVEGWLGLPDLPDGLALTCARGTHRESMPENILGALLYVAKPYAKAVENQKRGQWIHTVAQPLTGKTLGILGLGEIGQEVARLASSFGIRVIGTKRRPTAMPHVDEVLSPESTPEVLARSDFLLLLLPATPETDNFINAERLGLMKPTAWLLNFGRGHLIKDEDLIAAVKGRTIAGAVLDVFRQEPLPADHAFWKTDGIIVLPHIGGPHPQRDQIVARLFVDNLGRFLRNEPLRQVVDRSAGY
ncbi:Phosphoglycerate dehydrogenase [Enhydrobacter aerosaccus]|uniref:Phosphoglycerate dehydrogenase n=1 Tax=Enhydrobacter aerosaccus TaxID=225324 RepID=A0A1T4NWK0_9HYPH|nr:D-2-hydroxyacid dehydrogenase [Enhydrobacter aerosaccus]SJZ83437.1 Phosphoglycerate dehydrogenase [Enhydrobacter aerosaccus]